MKIVKTGGDWLNNNVHEVIELVRIFFYPARKKVIRFDNIYRERQKALDVSNWFQILQTDPKKIIFTTNN